MTSFKRTVSSMRMLSALVLLLSAQAGLAAPATTEPEAVVRQEVEALTEGKLDALVGLFSPDAVIHQPATTAHTLVGERAAADREQVRRLFETALAQSPQGRFEIIDTVALGELVVARVAVTVPTAPDRDNHHLSVFRVRDGAIRALYQIAKEYGAKPDSGTGAQAVIRRFADAADRNDVETFLSLFSPDAKNFHFRRDPEKLGGGPSKSVADQASREKAFREMFATSPARIEILDSLALGEWVVSHDRATQKDGSVSDGLSIYRVRDGKILSDWYVAEQAR